MESEFDANADFNTPNEAVEMALTTSGTFPEELHMMQNTTLLHIAQEC